jgi:hypothetical protein
MKKLGIFGSRSLFDESVRLEINEYLNGNGDVTTLVTCQEPRGVSEVAQRVARDRSLVLEVHFLNPHKGKGAFHCRAIEIVKIADEFLIIHDGKSKGTANELKMVEGTGKPFKYIVLDPSRDNDLNTGYNITDAWQRGNRYNDKFPGEVSEFKAYDL